MFSVIRNSLKGLTSVQTITARCMPSRLLCSDIEPEGANTMQRNEGESPRRNYERSVNCVFLMGRVGSNPEVRGQSPHAPVIFSLATNEPKYNRDTGEKWVVTLWHRMIVGKYGMRDLILERVKKGDRLHVKGRIAYTEFTDNETGRLTKIASILCDDIVFLGRSNRRDAEEYQESDDEF